MKKNLLIVFFITNIIAISCGSKDKKASGTKETYTSPVAAQADSAYNDVMKGHEEGMSGWMKIADRQKDIQRLLDSIEHLPVKTSAAANTLKTELTEVSAQMKSAYDAMDKWMPTLDPDHGATDPAEKLRYFTEQKAKVEEINKAINTSLQKADSLLNAGH